MLWQQPRGCYWMGEEIEAALAVSHYGDRPIENASLHWGLVQGERVLVAGSVEDLQVSCYQVQNLATIRLQLPTLSRPAKLTLRVSLQDGNQVLRNYWHLWAFPPLALAPSHQAVMLYDPDGQQAKLTGRFPFIRPAGEREAMAADVLVTTRLTDPILRYLERGGRVLWLENGNELNCRPYNHNPGVDYLATLITDHPVWAAFPHEGWCDRQFFNLIGKAVLDTGFFEPGKLTPIVETFHVPYLTSHTGISPFRRKGFLAEAQVGRGRLLATTFVLDGLGSQPEVDTLVSALLAYLLSPLPEAAFVLSGDDLREWVWHSVHGEEKTNWIPL